jgi:hypothetical protein
VQQMPGRDAYLDGLLVRYIANGGNLAVIRGRWNAATQLQSPRTVFPRRIGRSVDGRKQHHALKAAIVI